MVKMRNKKTKNTALSQQFKSNIKIVRLFLEMPVPSQGHYGFPSFPVVD
jgi:hypothetical protein